MEKQKLIEHCLNFENVYLDYPFRDKNWAVIRHFENKKVFAWIFEKDDFVWINLKCREDKIDFFRQIFKSVIPAYHLNKRYWNSVILDGNISENVLFEMIEESYCLTKIVGKK